MDVGYKKFLRCIRKALRQWFNEWCPTTELARYKWNKRPNKEERWFSEIAKFLEDQVKPTEAINHNKRNSKAQQNLTELQTWQTVFLI